jgi:hypothetical protein
MHVSFSRNIRLSQKYKNCLYHNQGNLYPNSCSFYWHRVSPECGGACNFDTLYRSKPAIRNGRFRSSKSVRICVFKGLRRFP